MWYLHFRLEAETPLRITRLSSSQSNQLDSRTYIPGSAVRGMVLGNISNQKKQWFQENKTTLLSDQVCFTNMYPVAQQNICIPAPKGFYSDKNGGNFQCVLENGQVERGLKRAALGQYCVVRGDKLVSCQVELEEKLRLNLQDREEKGAGNLFRNQFISVGQQFCGFIIAESKSCLEECQEVFRQKKVYIGAAQHSGFGRCAVISCEINKHMPYEDLSYREAVTEEEPLYMMALSPLAFRGENGEICGFNEEQVHALGEELGVDVKLEFCATSVLEQGGVNRTWHARTPACMMYEAGSVFKLAHSQKIEPKRLHQIEAEGIGIKRSEGCGRILFFREYEKIKSYETESKSQQDRKARIPYGQLKPQQQATLKIAAIRILRNRIDKGQAAWLAKQSDMRMGNASASQIGVVQAKCVYILMHDPETAIDEFEKFFSHQDEKSDKSSKTYQGLKKLVDDVLHGPDFWDIIEGKPQTICDVPFDQLGISEMKEKLRYLIRLFDYSRKGGVKE